MKKKKRMNNKSKIKNNLKNKRNQSSRNKNNKKTRMMKKKAPAIKDGTSLNSHNKMNKRKNKWKINSQLEQTTINNNKIS